MQNGYSIGQVARAAGLATSALRYYERAGLLPRAARVSGRRVYPKDILFRLAMIQFSKELGFTLSEIKTLVDGIALGDRSPKRFRTLAREKLPEIEATIERAKLMRRLLKTVDLCKCPTLEQCVKGAIKSGVVRPIEL